MAKLLALGAYVFQAVLAFGLLLAIARILSPADYATYSVFVGTTQLGAVAGFEWLRYACSRFYPGQTAGSERDQRRTLLIEGLVAVAACLVAGGVALGFGLSPALALGGGAVAAAQGGSDLHLSVVRFGQRFTAFSRLNVLRAVSLAIGSLSGSLLTRTVDGAVVGLVAVYLVYGFVAAAGDRKAYNGSGRFRRQIVREHLSYGGVSAGLSVLSMLAPLGLKLILTGFLGKEGAAGALLALDLLQRPFVMVVSALQAVEYPDVVAAFDRKASDFAQRLGRFYALMATLSLVSAAGVFVALRLVAEIIVSPALREGFLLTAPAVTLFAMLRALTQNIATTPAHLELDLRELALLGLIDCASFNALGYAGALLFGASPLAIAGSAAFGAVLAGLYGLRIATSLPFALSPWPLLIAGLSAAVAAGLYFVPNANLLLAAILAAISAGAISLAALLKLWTLWKLPDVSDGLAASST